MKSLTATELARNLSDVLDAVEHRGESFEITRKGGAVARLEPRPKKTVRDLIEVLERHPPDPDWWREIQEVRALMVVEERDWTD